jgi:DNA-binding FrmR family transcriptional regulator
MKAETFADKDRSAILARLRRVEGQIRGLQRMVDERRDCSEIVTQLSAARAALDRVGNVIVSSGLRGCLSEANLSKMTMDRVNTTLDALVSLRS